MTRIRGTLLVGALAGLLFLPPLGQRVLAPSDEARFVLYAREVLQQRAAFDVRVRAKSFREKPPLYAWLIAMASLPGGRVTEATAQLPIVAAAIVAAMSTFLVGERLVGRQVGMVGALSLIVTYGLFAHSQLLLPDMLVVAFICVAVHAFATWQLGEGRQRWPLIVFYLASAGAVYSKGPVGLLPFLIGAAWLWSEYGPGGLRRLWSPLGAVIFGLVTLTWLVPFMFVGSATFVQAVVWDDWIGWYVGRPRIGNLLLDAAVMCLPWTIIVPLALVSAIQGRRAPAVRLLLAWFLVSLVVMIPVANQRTRYLLPITPGMALLVAWWADGRGHALRVARRTLAWTSLAIIGAMLVVICRPRWFDVDETFYLTEITWAALPLVVAATLLATVFWWGLYWSRPRVLMYGGIRGMAVMLGYGIWPYTRRFNEIWDFPSLAAAIEDHANGQDVGVYGVAGSPSTSTWGGGCIQHIR